MIDKFTSMEQVEEYTAGEQIKCLECGKLFEFLGNHLRKVHGLTNEEYRERYGLPAMTALAGQAYRRAHREKIERLQATGALTYDHLPAATAKASATAKPKIGVAKIEHGKLITQLRPGDHHKIESGGKRADGRDADREREMQQLRRLASQAISTSALPEISHQERIKSAMERLVMGGTTKSPKLWICRQMEITKSELDSWLMSSAELGAVTPPKYAIKYLISLIPNAGGRTSRFTSDEDAYITANFPGRGGASKCANVLNRSIAAIRVRARRLGLQVKLERTLTWTDDHIAILRSHYLTDGAKYVAEKTGHTEASARVKAVSLNLTRKSIGGSSWTPEQDEVLREYCAEGDIKKAGRLIGRPAEECKARAKLLGIKLPEIPGNKNWSAEEDEILRAHYSGGKKGGTLPEKTGHTYAQCAKRAKEIGILPDETVAKKILAQPK